LPLRRRFWRAAPYGLGRLCAFRPLVSSEPVWKPTTGAPTPCAALKSEKASSFRAAVSLPLEGRRRGRGGAGGNERRRVFMVRFSLPLARHGRASTNLSRKEPASRHETGRARPAP